MTLFRAYRDYFVDIFSKNQNMSILLLDQDTTSILSAIMPQSELLGYEIYMIDRIDNGGRERLKYLDCIAFLRPTSASVAFLCQELANAHYKKYFLCFSNIIENNLLEQIAVADADELVANVQEIYTDAIPTDPILFSLNICKIFENNIDTWDSKALARSIDGLTSILLACKKKPKIRFEANSAMSRILATEIQYKVEQERTLFDFRQVGPAPLLLILDRKNDPITPLLSQWTYQAMIHELIGINNGRVNLSNVEGINPELKDIVLSASQDHFFAENMYSNFGDLGANIRDYVSLYQSKTRDSKSIQTIDDMKRFVEEFPEFKRLSGNVSKHVSLIGELSRLVEQEQLLQVSEIEQSLAVDDLQNFQAVENVMKSNVSDHTKMKMLALFAIKAQSNNSRMLSSLINMMQASTGNLKIENLIITLLKYAGESSRLETFKSAKDLLSRAKIGLRGLKGVENVYIQHQPTLTTTLKNLSRNKLSERYYQYIEGQEAMIEKPIDIIIYYIGGTTYEESRAVHEFLEANSSFRVLLGGTDILNSAKFFSLIKSLQL